MKSYKDKVRVICHSLKMNTLAGVDPNRTVDLSSRIRALPSPERISSMGHGDVLDLTKRVERLLFDIDNSRNSRTVGFAIRNRIDKGLPPRMRPVLAMAPNEDNAMELEEILRTMDVPRDRHSDYAWLFRNMTTRNSDHPGFERAMELAAGLAMDRTRSELESSGKNWLERATTSEAT